MIQPGFLRSWEYTFELKKVGRVIKSIMCYTILCYYMIVFTVLKHKKGWGFSNSMLYGK